MSISLADQPHITLKNDGQDTVSTRNSDHAPQQQASAFDPKLNRAFLVGLARAYGGAMIFALPMLMTMEMWWLGFTMGRWQLALLTVVTLPLLVGLSHFLGFESTFDVKEDVVDALVAYAVGFSASAVILALLAITGPEMSLDETLGKVALQAIPAAIGALLAQSEFGERDEQDEERQRDPGYFGTLFLMLVGALFLALNLAPTEEMVLIAYNMSPWHGVVLALVSLLVMHAFVYAVDFRGEAEIPEHAPLWQVILRYTVTGYALALVTSLFMLWAFGRTDGLDAAHVVMTTVVLGFPAAVGAAAARLIL